MRVPGGYRVSGPKIFITHAGVGEIFTVTAVTDPSAGPRGITSFVVTRPTTDLDTANRIGFGHSDTLEFVEGVTLRRTVALCRRHGIPLPLDLVAEIGRQICDGLAHAHAAGLFHLGQAHGDHFPERVRLAF